MADPDISNPGFTSQDDDLFQPTLQSPPRAGVRRDEAWRVRSQVWIAFFGGSLALAAIATLNSKRLNATPTQQRNVLLLGCGFFLLTLVAAYAFAGTNGDQAELSLRSFRLFGRAIALIAYLFLARLQQPAERIYRMRGGEYASLWRSGLVTVLVLGLLQNVLIWLILE